MNIYRLTSEKELFQFGDTIGSVPVLGKELKSCQNEIVERLGLNLIDIDNESDIQESSYLIFDDNIYFTEMFLKAVQSAAKKSSVSLRFGLEENSFNDRFILPADNSLENRLSFFYINKNRNKIEDFVVTQKIFDYQVAMPDQLVKGGVYKVPQCEVFAASIISPFHLLQINMAVNLNRTIKLQNTPLSDYFKKWKGRFGSRLFYSGLRRLNKIGKNCLIHPSAIIEGCIIGDNVKIGAGSVLRLSHIGDDVTVSDNVVVSNSVLGNRTFIANSNYIEMVLTYEEVFMIHGPYQFSVFGKKSAVFATINCDFRLDQDNIKIPTSRGIIDSKQPLLGIAYGHGSKVGGGNIIAAGRIVPNNLVVNPPDNIILKF